MQAPQPAKSLFQKVVTKQITSTPVGEADITSLSMPQGEVTPIDTFNCLQFSGTVKETSSSSSSSNVIDSSPNSMPIIMPSSPTEDTSSEIVLPKWNQELLQQERAREGGKKTSSVVSRESSSSSSGDGRSDRSESKHPSSHQWQSERLTDTDDLYPAGNGDGREEEKTIQPENIPSLHLLEDSENNDIMLPTSKAITVQLQPTSSLSPSSIVLKNVCPTQPTLSHDIFQPNLPLSQDSTRITHQHSFTRKGTCHMKPLEL